jgi:hypothetical protein
MTALKDGSFTRVDGLVQVNCRISMQWCPEELLKNCMGKPFQMRGIFCP